jgi:hypothetical protein
LISEVSNHNDRGSRDNFSLLVDALAMRQAILITLFLCVPLFGCSRKPTETKISPKVKPPALVDTEALPENFREAARAVAASISQAGEDPKEFFAEISSESGGQVLVFHLWHTSAFTPENNPPNGIVLGNPGGKCRNVYYDTKARRVTETLFWQ